MNLQYNIDALKVSFTLRVLGNLALPSACNDQDYQDYQAELAKKSTQRGAARARRRAASRIQAGAGKKQRRTPASPLSQQGLVQRSSRHRTDSTIQRAAIKTSAN